jgi:hypothetical protein
VNQKKNDLDENTKQFLQYCLKHLGPTPEREDMSLEERWQAMANELGLERAKVLRNDMSKAINEDVLGRIFPSVEYLEQCEGGFLPNLEKDSTKISRFA